MHRVINSTDTQPRFRGAWYAAWDLGARNACMCVCAIATLERWSVCEGGACTLAHRRLGLQQLGQAALQGVDALLDAPHLAAVQGLVRVQEGHVVQGGGPSDATRVVDGQQLVDHQAWAQ